MFSFHVSGMRTRTQLNRIITRRAGNALDEILP